MTLASSIVQRLDSWVNALTGLGTLRDKQTYTQAVPGCKLTDVTLEALYNDDDLAARIVDKVPREATRRGFSIELDAGEAPTEAKRPKPKLGKPAVATDRSLVGRDAREQESAQLTKEIQRAVKKLQLLQKLREAWIWGRLYGGGAVFIGANDGGRPDQPLDLERIRSIEFVNVLRKAQLTIQKRYEDPSAPSFGEAELYGVNAGLGTGVPTPSGVVIHESRLIVFRGALTARVWSPSPDGWDDSVLQRVHEVLKQTANSWQSTSHLLTDASQGVLKIANLVDLIATGGEAALRTRMQMMDMARSVCRSILIDAERENFDRVATSFTGVPEMLDRFMMRVAAAAEMPVTVLFGRSPAGLNATGESDIRGWYDTVAEAQADVLRPRLERAIEILMRSADGPTQGEVPEGWELVFKPLWQPTEKEQAETKKVLADAMVAVVGGEIVLESEAALDLAQSGYFPTIDVEARQEMLQDEIELAKEQAGEEPEPPGGPVPGDPGADPGALPRAAE